MSTPNPRPTTSKPYGAPATTVPPDAAEPRSSERPEPEAPPVELPLPGDGGPPAVELRGVRKRYGDREALRGASLTVPRGATCVLVGPNGAGKTTAMRTLLDLTRPDSGRVRVDGLDPATAGPEVRGRIGYLPERHEAGYAWMEVRQLLEHHAAWRRSWDAAYASELMERLEVRDHTTFGKLSKGESRRVQLVMALAHRPPILLLDEPTDGLDPVLRERALGMLAEHLVEHEATVLVSTHRIAELEGLGDHLTVLHEGVVRFQATREALRRRLRRYAVAAADGVPPASPGAGGPAPSGGPSALSGVLDRAAGALGEALVSRSGSGRERVWVVWGEPDAVVARLTAAGAEVRNHRTLDLEGAAVALLGRAVWSEPGASDPSTATARAGGVGRTDGSAPDRGTGGVR